MESSLKQQINLMIAKADETLEDMEILFDQGRYSAAAGRAYYAVFHLLSAVLLTKKLSFAKHSGVIGAFAKYFIKEGIFPRDFAGKIRKLWKNREIGDYEYERTISAEEAKQCVDDAQVIATNLKQYLSLNKSS